MTGDPLQAGGPGPERAIMTVDQGELQAILERVFARQDTLEACKRRDLETIIDILGRQGITQGRIASLTSISQGRLSEYKTGKRVAIKTSVFEDFATGLKMPAKARAALGLAPSPDAELTQHNGNPLDAPDAFDLQLLAEEIGKRGDVVKRRKMLSMAAGLGATAALAQTGAWERLTYALSRPTAVDEMTVRAVEARAAGFHQLEELIPAPALFKGLAAHLRETSALISGTAADPSDELRHRLIVAAGESAVLAGWLASDMGDSSTARNFYDAAERAAKETNDPGIVACALAYRSYIPSTKGAHGRARALLTDALDTLAEQEQRKISQGTLAWLSARHAEESAALGDTKQALNSWRRAQEAFSLADPAEDRVWTRFMDQNRFDSYHVATYANIGKLDEAQEIASALLARLPEPDRKKAVIILEEVAAAYLRQGAANDAARIGRDGLVLLRDTGFTMWLPRFESIGRVLARWNRQPRVRAYLEELKAVKRQFTASDR